MAGAIMDKVWELIGMNQPEPENTEEEEDYEEEK